MARLEMSDLSGGAASSAPLSGEMLVDLGLMHSTGAGLPADLVTAHMWFNIAAVRGHREAIRLRQEIACDMSAGEIAKAQRAARDWLSTH